MQWIEPSGVVIEAIRSGRSESEFVDGCHALLSIASFTTPILFDNLLHSLRPFGTIHFLSALTNDVVNAYVVNYDEEETWTTEALDVLLETWSVIFGSTDRDKDLLTTEGKSAASKLFKGIVESHLKAASETAYNDDDTEHFVASVKKRDERLESYAIIGRMAADITIPFLTNVFSERVAYLNQVNRNSDPTCILEELYWIILMIGHILTDSGEGETVLIPEALQVGFSDSLEETQHPVVILSWAVIDFSRRCLDSETRSICFSPRLMEAVIWFLARWTDTYLMLVDGTKVHISTPSNECLEILGTESSKKILVTFAGEHKKGEIVLDIIIRIIITALTSYPGENELLALTCQKLLVALVRRKNVSIRLLSMDSWQDLARAFSKERTFFPLNARLQRSLAETLVCAASGMKDPDASNQYVRDIMRPMTSYLAEISGRNDLKVVAQKADAMYMVICLLERLIGAARATQPRTQKAVFEMGVAVMNPLITLLEAYKNQAAVVYLIIKFVVDLVDGHVTFLEAKDTSVLVGFCLQLLRIYASNNMGKISLSHSSSLWNEAQIEKYKDLRALLQLLTNLCSKEFIDFSSDDAGSPDIAEVIFVGLHIVSPLISFDLLRYPKLNRHYFALVSHMLEVYPEKVAQLTKEAFVQVIAALDFGIKHQDIDAVDMCFQAVNALASYHYREKSTGNEGLGAHLVYCLSNGTPHENILGHFLRLIMQSILFADFRMDLSGPAADALLPLLFCEQDLYQRLVQEFLEEQQIPSLRSRLANAFRSLTSSNKLSISLDRANRHRFRKNFHEFLTEISGLRIK
ncbi:hypothetical protein AXF42_Ash013221 [Apostasia shenzhenica]|uniref:Exportin-4 n=1 Tax=Apostasia shenzhenica TaxID=1088818 RepID=A0A2I0BBC9_9ASPA|nr:hypothetical protein AXF42_Ash013221 [Apostasia shenzhenica]